MNKTAVVIQHAPHEDLGNLEGVLQQHQFNIQYYYAGQDNLENINPIHPNLFIVLGGPMGVYEQNIYPFLTTEIYLLQQRLAKDLPTLGICLGSQLMAKALGANVFAGPTKEIGWGTITLTKAGQQSCLKELSEIKILHWHGDTFDLPKNTIHLASSPNYQNQAFTVGRNGLALQFHPEVTAAEMQHWLSADNIEIKQNPKINLTQLHHETSQNIQELQNAAMRCWNLWFTQIGYS